LLYFVAVVDGAIGISLDVVIDDDGAVGSLYCSHAIWLT